MARRPSSVCPSARPSVNFCANRFFSHANGRIATKLAHDGLQVSMHPGCAQGQGQGQRSRDTCTFLDYWNELLRHWRSGLIITATRAGTEGCYEMLLFDRDDMIFKRLFRAVFGEIRWHFNTMLSRTVCRIYMDSLSRSYDVADDVRSSQVPVSWRNVHRMVSRRACIWGVLKVHVEVKGLNSEDTASFVLNLLNPGRFQTAVRASHYRGRASPICLATGIAVWPIRK